MARWVVGLPVSALPHAGLLSRPTDGDWVTAVRHEVEGQLEGGNLVVLRTVDGIGKKIDVRSFLRGVRVGIGREALNSAGIMGDLLPIQIDTALSGSSGVRVGEVVEALLGEGGPLPRGEGVDVGATPGSDHDTTPLVSSPRCGATQLRSVSCWPRRSSLLQLLRCGPSSWPPRRSSQSSSPGVRKATNPSAPSSTAASTSVRTRAAPMAATPTSSCRRPVTTQGTSDTPLNPDASCASTSVEGKAEPLPVDIIWVVDNSSSMQPAVAAINAGLNDFAASISTKKLDYKVIMLALRSKTTPITVGGGTRYPVCIPPPLAGDSNCGNGARFFQSHVDIKSTQPLEQFLGTLGQTNGYKVGGDPRR